MAAHPGHAFRVDLASLAKRIVYHDPQRWPPMNVLDVMNSMHESNRPRTIESLRNYVAGFLSNEALTDRVTTVLAALPIEVQCDLLEDPCFRIALEDYVPGRGSVVWMDCPIGFTRGHRAVVLRARLSHCVEEFAHYIIAHELAHAFLWNGGWGDIADREHAADALAASWGFVRPREWPFFSP